MTNLLLGFRQRDSYIETPTEDEVESTDNSGPHPPMMINRNVSSIMPRPAQRPLSSVSSPPPVDDLSPFNWYPHYDHYHLSLDY